MFKSLFHLSLKRRVICAYFMMSLLCCCLMPACTTNEAERNANQQSSSLSHTQLSKEQRLHKGMTKAQVRQIFGKPQQQLTTSEGEIWEYNDGAKALIPFYAIAGKFSSIEIEFNLAGKVEKWQTAKSSLF